MTPPQLNYITNLEGGNWSVLGHMRSVGIKGRTNMIFKKGCIVTYYDCDYSRGMAW
jgi:hypothetical protein